MSSLKEEAERQQKLIDEGHKKRRFKYRDAPAIAASQKAGKGKKWYNFKYRDAPQQAKHEKELTRRKTTKAKAAAKAKKANPR